MRPLVVGTSFCEYLQIGGDVKSSKWIICYKSFQKVAIGPKTYKNDIKKCMAPFSSLPRGPSKYHASRKKSLDIFLDVKYLNPDISDGLNKNAVVSK